MSLEQNGQKSKYFALWQIGGLVLTLGVIGLLVFNLLIWGKVSTDRGGGQIVLEEASALNFQDYTPTKSQEVGDWEVAASKNGKKYYFPGCSGLKRIKKDNLVFFETEAEAVKTGLTLAKNCSK